MPFVIYDVNSFFIALIFFKYYTIYNIEGGVFMNDKHIELSENEEQILQTMWREDRPLTRSEIINLTENKTWKESSIHILLNQLLDKKAIYANEIVKTGKGFGRTYLPLIKKDDYDFNKLKNEATALNPSDSSIKKFLSFLVKSDKITSEEIDDLEDLLK